MTSPSPAAAPPQPTTGASGTGTLDRLRARWTWTAVVANLVGQIVIIGTGGAVRLTGSGLGCSTWPQCEPGQFTPQFHAAASFHPFVEFGNRTISGVLGVIGLAVLLLVSTDRSRSAGYRWLGTVPLLGVLAQAVIGGITVLVDLNPAVVGLHLLISMALVALSAWLVARTREGDGPAVPLTGRTTHALAWLLGLLSAVVVVLGVIVTGAGPHSGDEEVGYRFAVDPYQMARVHSASVWAFVLVLVVLLVRLHVAGTGARPRHTAYVLLGVTLVQGLIGYVQLFTGLPVVLVNLHMIGAGLLIAATVWVIAAQRARTRTAG